MTSGLEARLLSKLGGSSGRSGTLTPLSVSASSNASSGPSRERSLSRSRERDRSRDRYSREGGSTYHSDYWVHSHNDSHTDLTCTDNSDKSDSDSNDENGEFAGFTFKNINSLLAINRDCS